MVDHDFERAGVFDPDQLREIEAELNAKALPGETADERAHRALGLLYRRSRMADEQLS